MLETGLFSFWKILFYELEFKYMITRRIYARSRSWSFDTVANRISRCWDRRINISKVCNTFWYMRFPRWDAFDARTSGDFSINWANNVVDTSFPGRWL
jgi:hypothetical protein